MPVYELTADAIVPLERSTFREANLRERDDLQRLLRDRIDVIAPGCLVLAEEFGEWEDSRRRIDLLALDAEANLVVIELKRTEDGGHMELQALRYAAMVSTMTFEQAVRAHAAFLRATGRDADEAESAILEHLGVDEIDEDAFAQDVRIVLASAQFSRELTGAVLWLNERGLDIRCVRLIPYRDNERVLLDVQQVIPLPEAEAYQVGVREKSRCERESRRSTRDFTKYDVVLANETFEHISKREMVYRVVRAVCDAGHTPDDILTHVTLRRTNSFCEHEGVFDSEGSFVEAVADLLAREGRRFDPRRWYTGDDERIVVGNKTYALSNQWGGRAKEWADLVVAAFPDVPIEIRVSPVQ